MSFLGEWMRRIWFLLNRTRLEAVLEQEMDSHRAMMPDPVRFGNRLQLRERSRDVWGWGWLDDISRDVRVAARGLGRAPGFTVVAVVSLALGLAVTASTLAVVNAYLIRSLPYPASDRLYAVMYEPPGPHEPSGMTALDWSSLSEVVEFAATSTGETFNLADRGNAETARGLRVSDGFIRSLGMQPAIGRGFREEEFRPGAEQVAMISYGMWRNRFGSDPGIVGRQVRAYTESESGPIETSLRIVGVLEPVFWYQPNREGPEIVAPLRAQFRTYMVQLRWGVPVAEAERRITEVARRVGTDFPPNWTGVHLEPVHDRYVTGMRPVLLGITVPAALLLLIVCANVAVLMLLRTVRRQKEMGVRVALGAGRTHIVRMLTAETCLLCGAGLVAGLALTELALNTLAPFIEKYFERPAPGGLSVTALDPTMLLAIGGTGLLMAVSLAFIPLLPAWQRRFADALRREGRGGTESPSMRRLQSTLIAFEVAGSLALLVGSGLMVRSIVNLFRTDLGFEMAQVGYAHLVLPSRVYTSPPPLIGFYDPLVERVSASARSPIALGDFVPFSEPRKQPVQTDDGRAGTTAGVRAVNAGYFTTLGIEIRQGRTFSPADKLGAEPVALVSETLARQLWPNASPLGRRLLAGDPPRGDAPPIPWRTVVGVVRDVRQTYTDDDLGDVYLSFSQAPSRFASMYLRTDQAVSSWLPAARGAIAQLDPYVIVNASGALAAEDRQLEGTTFLTSMLTGFAAFTVFLALLGIYGVTAYTVQQREREIAIRLALGATGDTIVRMFLKEVGVVLAAGVAGGLFGAVVVARMLEHQIHGVKPLDPSTFAATCTLMITTGVLATWWPARRAATRSPNGMLNEI